MKTEDVQKLIDTKIPITKALKFEILEFSEGSVSIKADLKTNANLHNTAFAGSISSILIMTGWLRAYQLMLSEDPDAFIVLKSSSTDYYKPVTGDLVSCTRYIPSAKKERFLAAYRQDGKGLLEIESFIGKADQMLALFKGVFYIRKKG